MVSSGKLAVVRPSQSRSLSLPFKSQRGHMELALQHGIFWDISHSHLPQTCTRPISPENVHLAMLRREPHLLVRQLRTGLWNTQSISILLPHRFMPFHVSLVIFNNFFAKGSGFRSGTRGFVESNKEEIIEFNCRNLRIYFCLWKYRVDSRLLWS